MDARDFIQSEWVKGSDIPEGKKVKATITDVGQYADPKTGANKAFIRIQQFKNKKLDLNNTRLGALIGLIGTSDMNKWRGVTVALFSGNVNVHGEMKKSVYVDSKYIEQPIAQSGEIEDDFAGTLGEPSGDPGAFSDDNPF